MADSEFYLIQVENTPYIKKNFLNADEVVYRVKDLDVFVTSETLSKLVKYRRLIDRNQYPLENNEVYNKFYEKKQ